ncbi:hypothetical protein [Lentzea sp. NPDC051838]|uniref:hypothetical protein n=1 Tax=Lentzea sp. NPDC051838 TaxID=3154849 RepID=UPI00341CAD9A
MTDPLDQLYKTKLQLIAVLLAAAGIGLIIWGYWLAADAREPDVLSAAAVNFGFAFVTTALVAFIFEYLDRKYGEQQTKQGLREAVRAEAPAIREAVLDSLAFNTEELKDIVSKEQLDRIAAGALALRLEDKQLAHELYADLRDQVITAPERWHDVNINVSLRPWEHGSVSGTGSMFVATIRWEYKTKLSSNIMRFACVADGQEYRELLRDPTVTSAWHFDASGGVDPVGRDVFELLSFTVDGAERKIRRTTRLGAQIYSVGLAARAADREVTVAYTYRVLAQRNGHLLYLDLPRPVKGLRLRLDYSQAEIKRVNVLDYFASSQVSRVEQAQAVTDAKVVNISFDGWTLPRAGVAFVWVLKDELVATEHTGTH